MKKPLYQKIQGSELTSDQYRSVADSFVDKYGIKFPSDLKENVFYFSGNNFMGVWR